MAMSTHSSRAVVLAGSAVVALAATLAGAGAASAHGSGASGGPDQRLAPRTHFTMAADGSSGTRVGGEGIPTSTR